MSFQGDIVLGKWLVKEGHAPKEIVEKCLTAIQKSEKEGLKAPPLLKMLYQQGILGKEDVFIVQKAWGERKQGNSSVGKSSTEPSPKVETITSEVPLSKATIPSIPVEVLKSIPDKSTIVAEKCQCPECQSSNSTENINCSTCGAPLLRSLFVQCGYCHVVQSKGDALCRACGCDLKTGKASHKSRVCNSCKSTLKQGEMICLSCGSPYDSKEHLRRRNLGVALMILQLVGLAVGMVWFHKNSDVARLGRPMEVQVKRVDVGDPFGDLSARSIVGDSASLKLSEENRRWISSLLVEAGQKNWQIIQRELEEKEDQLGVHGALMLGLCFFQLDRGEELLGLQKAYPEQKNLIALASAWRLKKAISNLKEFDALKAYRTLLPVLKSGSASAEQYFWGGMMAFATLNYEESIQWFRSGLLLPSPIHQSHLFLYLLLKKNDPAASEAELRKLLGDGPSKKAMEKLVSPYGKGGS